MTYNVFSGTLNLTQSIKDVLHYLTPQRLPMRLCWQSVVYVCMLCSTTTSVTAMIRTTDLDQQTTALHLVVAIDHRFVAVPLQSASTQV